MNPITHAAGFGLLAFVLGLSIAQAPPAPQSGTAENDEAARQDAANRHARREDMRREVDEATRAIGAFSKAESDQALERAKSALEAMDRRIEDARHEWERDAARMSADAREQRDRAMTELRTQRVEVAERYRALQGASSATWERVREQFLTSYQSLAARVRRLSNADPTGGEPSTGDKPEPSAEPEESPNKEK